MKKIILSLVMLASIGSYAGNPEIVKSTKAEKDHYTVTPQPLTESPNGYLVECCHTSNLGYDAISGCWNILVICSGQCAGHGWLVSGCGSGTIIRGAFLVPEATRPLNMSLELNTGIIDSETFDVSQDPIRQIIEMTKIKNTIINLENDMVVESDDNIVTFKKGKYQIIDSKLLIIAE